MTDYTDDLAAIDGLGNPIPGPLGIGSPITTPNHATLHSDVSDGMRALKARTAGSWTAQFFGIQGDIGDETAALQTALSEIPEGSQLVFDARKNYTFGHVPLTTSFIRLTTAGGIPRNLNNATTITLADNTNDSLFYIPLTTQGVEICGFTLDGNSANQTGTSHAIEFEEGDGLPTGDARHKGKALHDLYITDFLTDGIHGGRSAAGLGIEWIQVLQCGRDGVRLAGDTDKLTNSLIGFNGRRGVFVEGPSAHITDCDIYQNVKGLYLGVFAGGGASATNTTVKGTVINVNQEEGIYIEDQVLYTEFDVSLSYNGSAVPGTKAQVYFAGTTASCTPTFRGRFYGNPAALVSKYDYEIASANGRIRDEAKHYGHYTDAISNRPDNIEFVANGPLTTNGQVVFPATPNPSTNVNTLDDYKEGTFTPVLTCATPGDLAVTYSAQQGRYHKIGNWVWWKIRLVTSSFSSSTASGTLRITGLPYTCSTGTNWSGACAASGWFKNGYTMAPLISTVTTGTAYVQLMATGSVNGLASTAFLQRGDMSVDGTQLSLDMTGVYEA